MSIIGVGVALTPWKLVGAKSSIQRFRLPPASVHIPHGNFASTVPQITQIEEMSLEISVQRFMKNGIEDSMDDMTVYTFKKGSEILNISVFNGSCSKIGNIEGLELDVDSKSIILSSNKHRLNLHLDSNSVEVHRI